MKVDFVFKGMMVPVFTPFIDDKNRTINYDMIDKYGHYLKTVGMHGVMVNGSTGDGMTLTVDERMKIAEKWMEVTRKYDLKMLLNIGGTNIFDVYTLAEHAEKIKVDAVMVLPDLFYKSITVEDLVLYLKDIVIRMPTRPLFYYHIPLFTNVFLDMHRFLKVVEKEVTTFTGIYWAHDKIDLVMMLKDKFPMYNFIIGTLTSMMGFMVEGIDAISMTSMNLFPELVKDVHDLMINRKINDGITTMTKLTKRIRDVINLEVDTDFLLLLRTEMDKLHPTLRMGPIRHSRVNMTKLWLKGL